MSHDVFISYSSKDEAPALALCRALEAAGLGCWIACRDINAGANYDEAIIDAIERATTMVVLLSANTKEATGVDDEVRNARDLKIKIRPVRIEKVELSRALRFHLKGPQFLDAFDADGSLHFDRVADKLARAIKPAPAADAEPSQPGPAGGGTQPPQGLVADSATAPVGRPRQRVIYAAVLLATSLGTFAVWKWTQNTPPSKPTVLGDSTTGRATGPVVSQAGHASLKVRVLDVGQGDATLVENGSSRVLIDGGPSPQRFGKLLDSLSLNDGTFDMVVLTHPHADHYGGLAALFESQRHIKIRYFFENMDSYPAALLQRLRDSVKARESRTELTYRDTDDPCTDGRPVCTFVLSGGARLHLMRPMPVSAMRKLAPGVAVNANDRSVAIKLIGPDSATFSMWLAGDAEQEEIAWFLGAAHYDVNPGTHVDVLKADHHGSCNGVSEAYLAALHPRLVIASVDSVNLYRHMSTQIKKFFETNRVPWYRTDENGSVTLMSSGVAGEPFTFSTQKTLATNRSGPADTTSGIPCP